MPEAIVAKCCAPNCNHYQLVVQRLPGKDEYFNCKKCTTSEGDQSRQPFRVATTPDGQVLRSYDVQEMRSWAKKLNKQANGNKFDGMIAWQKSRHAQLHSAQCSPGPAATKELTCGTSASQDLAHACGGGREARPGAHLKPSSAGPPRAAPSPLLLCAQTQVRQQLKQNSLSEDMLKSLELESTVSALHASRA